MRRVIFSAVGALLFSVAAIQVAAAQESYTYSVTRTHSVLINWRPTEKTFQRYTVAVSPLRLVSHGIKFDFERELSKPGYWLGTSLSMYLATPRDLRYGDSYWDREGNNRKQILHL